MKPQIGSQEADEISGREWQSFQNKHAAVDYVYYAAGQISCKNPSEEQLATLAKMAFTQGWRLRGTTANDDDSGRVISEVTPKQGIFGAIKNIFAERRAARELAAEMEAL